MNKTLLYAAISPDEDGLGRTGLRLLGHGPLLLGETTQDVADELVIPGFHLGSRFRPAHTHAQPREFTRPQMLDYRIQPVVSSA